MWYWYVLVFLVGVFVGMLFMALCAIAKDN